MFKVQKVDQPLKFEFTVTNVSYKTAVMKNGIQPMVKREYDSDYEAVPGKIVLVYNPSKDKKHLSLSFQYQYDPIIDGTLYFAISYPYSYLKYQRKFAELLNQYSKEPDIFFTKN